MRIMSLCVVLGGALLLPLSITEVRAAPKEAQVEARQVVVRRARKLDAAILAAYGPREPAPNGTVALVLDATPHTRDQAGAIADALRALDGHALLPRQWRVAVLGRTFVGGPWSAGELAARIPLLLMGDRAVPDTIGALRRTVKSLTVRGATVIYLADWRFEDEHKLEKLIRDLASRQLGFGVVGSEAAFGRGWNDGVLDMRDQLQDGKLVLKDPAEQKRYDESIGRRPFGPFDAKAPWHGGDTAYPHVPYRYAGRYWETTFDPSMLSFGGSKSAGIRPSGQLEDLLQRLGRKPETFTSASSRRTALPSAFGPYGLMRAAAERGGRYVLWSWNPDHRASLEYQYARCDRFGPDLRSRAAIRKDAARRPLARALLQAWDQIGSKFNALAEHTAPLDRGGSRPQSIDLLERSAATLHTMWMDRNMHREFLRKAKHWRGAAASAEKLLTRALERAKEPLDAPDSRYAADAALFRHIVQVLHFEISEAIAAAETTPEDAWKAEDTYPGIRPTLWIHRGDDPEDIRTSDAHVFDPDLGARLKAARSEHLRRFGGTPFGVQVAANTVETWVASQGRKLKPSTRPLNPTGRTPSESQGDTPTPTPPRRPGGGSTGGGPSTGK